MHKTPPVRAGSRRSITEAELPFSCPPPDAPVWDLHPRVFLQIDRKQPEQSCPYCGTHYVLTVSDDGGDD